MMRMRELAVAGAFLATPQVFADERGTFTSPFQESALVRATGRALFPVRQTSFSTSRQHVARGVHYTATPPGGSKLVSCPRGRVRDYVVDLRVGSPTFGRWDSVELDGRRGQLLYLPTGLGHLFVALEEDTLVSYALSAEYVPENERAIRPTDPELGLGLPEEAARHLSRRDIEAPLLAEALAAGLLPDYEQSLRLDDLLPQQRGQALSAPLLPGSAE